MSSQDHRRIALDVTFTNPLGQSAIENGVYKPGRQMEAAVKRKVNTHSRAAHQDQSEFKPLVFDYYGNADRGVDKLFDSLSEEMPQRRVKSLRMRLIAAVFRANVKIRQAFLSAVNSKDPRLQRFRASFFGPVHHKPSGAIIL